MKNLLFLLLFVATNMFAQSKQTPKPSNADLPNVDVTQTPKDSVIYLTPTGEVFDTIAVYAIVAYLKQPALLQEYKIITKYFVYPNGQKRVGDQFLVGQLGVVQNFKKRLIFIMNKADYTN